MIRTLRDFEGLLDAIAALHPRIAAPMPAPGTLFAFEIDDPPRPVYRAADDGIGHVVHREKIRDLSAANRPFGGLRVRILK